MAGSLFIQPREGLLLLYLYLLPFDISALLAFGLEEEDSRGGVAFLYELVKVAFCEVENAILDGVYRALVFFVRLEPSVMSGAVDTYHLRSGRYDTERLLEGFQHSLFFGVGCVGF